MEGGEMVKVFIGDKWFDMEEIPEEGKEYNLEGGLSPGRYQIVMLGEMEEGVFSARVKKVGKLKEDELIYQVFNPLSDLP